MEIARQLTLKLKGRVLADNVLGTKAGRPYATGQVDEIVREFRSGETLKAICDKHERSATALVAKLYQLGHLMQMSDGSKYGKTYYMTQKGMRQCEIWNWGYGALGEWEVTPEHTEWFVKAKAEHEKALTTHKEAVAYVAGELSTKPAEKPPVSTVILSNLTFRETIAGYEPKIDPENHGKFYSKGELDALVEAFKRGKSIVDIAKSFKRRNDGILYQLVNKGLLNHKGGNTFYLNDALIRQLRIWEWPEETLDEWRLTTGHEREFSRLRLGVVRCAESQTEAEARHQKVLSNLFASGQGGMGKVLADRLQLPTAKAESVKAGSVKAGIIKADSLLLGKLSDVDGEITVRKLDAETIGTDGSVTYAKLAATTRSAQFYVGELKVDVEITDGILTITDSDGNVIFSADKTGITSTETIKEFTMKIESITLINGRNVVELSDSELINTLAKLEGERNQLSKLETQTALVDKKIAEVNANIKSLTAIMDSRVEKSTKTESGVSALDKSANAEASTD